MLRTAGLDRNSVLRRSRGVAFAVGSLHWLQELAPEPLVLGPQEERNAGARHLLDGTCTGWIRAIGRVWCAILSMARCGLALHTADAPNESKAADDHLLLRATVEAVSRDGLS